MAVNTIIHFETSVYRQFSIIVFDMLGQVLRQIDVAGISPFDVSLSGFDRGRGCISYRFLTGVKDRFLN